MYLNFDDIKKRVSVESAAQMLGLKTRRHSSDLRSACPACRTGGDRILSLALTGHWANTFTCWAVKPKPLRGDVIGLTAHILSIDQQAAAAHLAKHFGLDSAATAPSPTPNKEDVKGMEPLDYLDALHDAVEALGITAVTAGEVGIGYAEKGTMRGRVLIPIRLPTGELIGYCGIKLDDEVPFKFPANLEQRATGNVVKLERRKA